MAHRAGVPGVAEAGAPASSGMLHSSDVNDALWWVHAQGEFGDIPFRRRSLSVPGVEALEDKDTRPCQPVG